MVLWDCTSVIIVFGNYSEVSDQVDPQAHPQADHLSGYLCSVYIEQSRYTQGQESYPTALGISTAQASLVHILL